MRFGFGRVPAPLRSAFGNGPAQIREPQFILHGGLAFIRFGLVQAVYRGGVLAGLSGQSGSRDQLLIPANPVAILDDEEILVFG